MKNLIDKLSKNQILSKNELLSLVKCQDKETLEYLQKTAEKVRQANYGKDIYIRGLIEISSYCKNDCYYCGLRRSNKNADRYRLTKEQILDCCKTGYGLGFRTFVMQGGEDKFFTDDVVCDIVKSIKNLYPDCAVTLSLGERSKESYQAFYNAGADRYLLRHETANSDHYAKLHPADLTLENRKNCLYNLKEIGFQTGCGFMVGSPYQTDENIVEDLLFIKELQPEMVGIGPFISHKDTPFKDMKNGTLEKTLKLLAIIRLMLPKVLLPSTTALGTVHPTGRELGILWGGNVVMPNLSPTDVRKKYMLYDNKISTGDEAAESRYNMEKRMEKIGYKVVEGRGDHSTFKKD